MKRTVHIVAVAARTPVGLTAEASAAAVRAGISRVREHPFMVESNGEKVCCARDGRLAATLLSSPRVAALAQAALQEISDKLNAVRASAAGATLLLALPEVRPGFGADDARVVQRALLARPAQALPGLQIETVGEGHAGALEAMERGTARIAIGHADVVLIGGVDSYLEGDTLDWLDAERRLARAGVRAGFAPGEGAAMLVLASRSASTAMGLASLAEVAAVTCTHEKRDPSTGAGLLGEALSEAIVRVAGSRIGQRTPVDDVFCDINGERSRTTDWGFALLRASSWLRDATQYVTPVAACGDLGAASAAFNAVLTVRAWQRGYARGPRSLIWGASWHGLRGAALLERGDH